ncbi:hypothetical protein [Streptomyces odonnellii]|uniref:hypothetical protein n=1 Tax=Streptomyces odonnellii TaxID=1417980 RepID=UPI0006259A85|nr:hypothetical protein [Streptomyces odonnellii]
MAALIGTRLAYLIQSTTSPAAIPSTRSRTYVVSGPPAFASASAEKAGARTRRSSEWRVLDRGGVADVAVVMFQPPRFLDIMIKLWMVWFERQGIGQDRDNEEAW